MRLPRQFPVPASARTAILGSAANADQLDLAATYGSMWAAAALVKENQRAIADVCVGDHRLPYGVVAAGVDELVITGLVRDGQVWHGEEWGEADGAVEAVPLDAGDVAFVARALQEGCTHIVLRGYTPVAFIADAGAVPDSGTAPKAPKAPEAPEPSGLPDLPQGAKVLAIVDDLDRNAVLDLVAVLPGPKVMRRHDGHWTEDPNWVRILRSVKPPPVVQLDETQVASVLPQIDENTKGQPFTKEPPKKATAASGLDSRADEMAIAFALLAAGPANKAASKLTPGGTMPPGFQKYWLTGPGAAKIRWGSPGAWTRCHRLLSKYIGPFRSKGACTNLSEKLGGPGVATHVRV